MSDTPDSAPGAPLPATEAQLGIASALAAYLIWGLVPIFFKQLVAVPATEIIAHRVVWSLLLMTAILFIGRGFGDVRSVVRSPLALLRIALASMLVMGNWLVFVYCVNEGRILETSLGYFILPLFSIALGLVVLGEKLRRLQWLAVALAAAGVALEATRLGGVPWFSLVLAGTFSLYSLLRKQLPLDAASGLFIETACMTPLAMIYLAWLWHEGRASYGLTLSCDLLLIGCGVLTAIPLLLFAIGARRLPLNVMGFLQYTAPTLTFLVAVFIYDEPLSPSRLVAFALIWAGLGVFTADLLQRRRAGLIHPPGASRDRQ